MRQATIHLSAESLEALGLGDLVSTFQAAGLIQVKELQCQRSGCLLALTVAEPLAEEGFSCPPDLEWWARLGTDPEGRVEETNFNYAKPVLSVRKRTTFPSPTSIPTTSDTRRNTAFVRSHRMTSSSSRRSTPSSTP